MEAQLVIKDLNRRRLLIGLLGIPAILLGIEEALHQPTAARQVVVNQDRMSFFEEEMAVRWDMYHTGGAIRAARGLPTWIEELTTFALSARETAWQHRTYCLLGGCQWQALQAHRFPAPRDRHRSPLGSR